MMREGHSNRKSITSLQKIIAFQSAFERILDITREEGYSDGAIVVQDCLTLAINLLEDNSSNQTYFREAR
jgi:hypothetical protein